MMWARKQNYKTALYSLFHTIQVSRRPESPYLFWKKDVIYTVFKGGSLKLLSYERYRPPSSEVAAKTFRFILEELCGAVLCFV